MPVPKLPVGGDEGETRSDDEDYVGAEAEEDLMDSQHSTPKPAGVRRLLGPTPSGTPARTPKTPQPTTRSTARPPPKGVTPGLTQVEKAKEMADKRRQSMRQTTLSSPKPSEEHNRNN